MSVAVRCGCSHCAYDEEGFFLACSLAGLLSFFVSIFCPSQSLSSSVHSNLQSVSCDTSRNRICTKRRNLLTRVIFSFLLLSFFLFLRLFSSTRFFFGCLFWFLCFRFSLHFFLWIWIRRKCGRAMRCVWFDNKVLKCSNALSVVEIESNINRVMNREKETKYKHVAPADALAWHEPSLLRGLHRRRIWSTYRPTFDLCPCLNSSCLREVGNWLHRAETWRQAAWEIC